MNILVPNSKFDTTPLHPQPEGLGSFIAPAMAHCHAFYLQATHKDQKIFTRQMSHFIHRSKSAGHRGSRLATWLGAPGAFRKQAAEFKIQG